MSNNIIPVGSLVPLSGPSAIDGGEFRKGLLLAVEEINERGGILGRPIVPVFADTGRQTADEVVAAAARLIEEHRVHAIINGYNIGPQNSEYETVADAGIIYINHNTLLQHHDTVQSNPSRYFGCFMANPAEYWYGQGLIKFLSWLRDTGQWQPSSNRIAIVSGSKPYSIVIANAIANAAGKYGWSIGYGPRVVSTPRSEWHDIIKELKACEPAVIANTHFYAGDLAAFQRQFFEAPCNALVYLQYGAMHQAFADLAGQSAGGVIVSAVTGLLRDQVGEEFGRRYLERFGADSTPQIGCQCYNAMHHFAIAASVAGGTGGPGDLKQNRKVAKALIDIPYRGVAGTIKYHPSWQAAVPFPDHVHDPSLGMPHLFYQVHNASGRLALIAPAPYNVEKFFLPDWYR